MSADVRQSPEILQQRRPSLKSADGRHWASLDHVRALAAFMVFSWHFIHGSGGYPVPFEGAPFPSPLVFLDEGHAGVSLFMCLSGYLFAKLIGDRAIDFPAFLWNRFLRLAPLLTIVLAIATIVHLQDGETTAIHLQHLVLGLMLPVWPNGGWSITVELQFYAFLPVILIATIRYKYAPLLIVGAFIILRCVLLTQLDHFWLLSYTTLLGRADQFLLGIFAFYMRDRVAGRHGLASVVLTLFMLAYWQFDRLGGYQSISGDNASTQAWILLPTIEAIAFSFGIAYYDNSFSFRPNKFLRVVEMAGSYSYFIYLFHFFIYAEMAMFIDQNVMDLSNFYVACLWAAICFAAFLPLGYCSYRFIEAPFLRWRRPYVLEQRAPVFAGTAAAPAQGTP